MRKKVFSCVAAKMTRAWYFSKGSVQLSLETHRHSYRFFFSRSDDGSIKYGFPGRNALLKWVSKSTYFTMMCFKLYNISRHLKDSRLAAIFLYPPISQLSH